MTAEIVVNTENEPFNHIQNIDKFIFFSEMYGVNRDDLFTNEDLYENTNMGQVIHGINALREKVIIT